uniref:AIG1-type G domain-containing protein n=1 Tax=Astyanax mexicanus TaxID=7994 RepID=A0A3B1IP51_ASTMX
MQTASTDISGIPVFGLMSAFDVSTDRRQKPDELRIVLLGKKGVGKSATANTISGTKLFKEDFASDSVTIVCQKESTNVAQRRINVIDTRGLFDTYISNDEIKKEIEEKEANPEDTPWCSSPEEMNCRTRTSKISKKPHKCVRNVTNEQLCCFLNRSLLYSNLFLCELT